jgi:hypothetical protein
MAVKEAQDASGPKITREQLLTARRVRTAVAGEFNGRTGDAAAIYFAGRTAVYDVYGSGLKTNPHAIPRERCLTAAISRGGLASFLFR